MAETGNENPTISNQDSGSVGYWKLRGDCQDYSGHNNHGINHGVDFNVANNKNLLIGFGAEDYFSGKIRDLRIYNRALNVKETDQDLNRP